MARKKVTIELTEGEAKLFQNMFRKHQDIWEEAKKLCPGTLTLHFNGKNDIKGYEVRACKSL